jgi:iron complex transport system permease protein
MKRSGKIYIIASLFAVLLLACLVSLSVGSVKVEIRDIIDVLISKLGIGSADSSAGQSAMNIIWDLRLPRILLVIGVGMALSTSGAVYQSILRNPLVDPFILGVSSGAAFGAAAAIVIPGFPFSIEICAFFFSIIGVLSAYLIARVRGQTPVVTMILAGIIINSFFASLVSLLQYLSNNSDLRELSFWLLGGFYYSDWKDALTVLPLSILGCTVIWLFGWRLNILTLGDDEAKSLGVNPEKNKLILVIIATLITAVSVSTAGIIAWIGLMVPHLARLIMGPDNRYLVPASSIMGAIILVLCDTISRNLTVGEIPVGIITSIVGAPYIVFLIKSKRKAFFG